MKTFLKIGLIVFIIGIVSSVGFGLWAYPELKKEEELVDKSYTYEQDVYEGIHLEFRNQAVEMKKSTDGKIHIDFIHEKHEEVTVVDTGSTLTISVTSTWWDQFINSSLINFGDWFVARKATIQLPESLYKVYIKTTNGGFTVNGVDTESMELRTTNGIIMVENSHSDSFLLKTSNGAIVLTNVEAVNIKGDSSNGRLTFTNLTAEVINAETSNGNIILDVINSPKLVTTSSNGTITGTNITSNNMKFNTSNGGINLTVKGLFEDYKVKTKTSNGNVKINEAEYGNATYHDTKIPYLEAMTSNGNVKITFEN